MDKFPPDHFEKLRADPVYKRNFINSQFEQSRKDKSIEMCEIFHFVVDELEKKGYFRGDSGFLSAAAILTSSVFQSEG